VAGKNLYPEDIEDIVSRVDGVLAGRVVAVGVEDPATGTEQVWVIAEADFAGSTSAMISYVGKHRPARVVMVTECSMSDNVAVEFPDVEFVRPCNLCPHMKKITLPRILNALETMTVEVTIDPAVAARARAAVERMLAVPPLQRNRLAA